MTPEELVKLIDENIVGQGTQIDAGSVLPIILKGILDLGGGGSDPLAVKYIEQTRTEAEKAIARENIGAMEMMNVDLEPTDNSGNLVMSGGVKRYVDERTKQEYFLVSTFTGLEGDKKALYYLDTAYDNYEKGFYRYEENEYVPGSITKEFKLLELQSDIVYVSTFAGVAGDTKSLYFLDTAYDTYKKGFYRYVASAGTTPAHFAPLLVFVEVFTDVDTLPTTGISKDTIYRIKDIYYEYEGQRVEKDTLTFYGPGAQALNMACDNTNGLAIETTSQSYQYPLADITDALVAQLITDQLIQVKPTDTDAPMFKLGTDSYGPSGEITEVDGGYKLYHNPTETDGEYIEIGGGDSVELDDITTEEVNGKIQANAIIDVDVFPTTDIKEATFYRKREDHFIDASDNEVIAVAKYICDGTHLEAIAVGLVDKSTGVPTPWAALTDAIVDGYVAAGYCRVTEAIGDTPNTLYFIKTGTDQYAHLMCIKTKSLYHHEDGAWKLVSEDPETDGVTTEKVNNKLQANAIIDVTSLPTTGIKAKTIYRMLVDRYFEDGTVLPARPTGYLSTRPAIVIIDETGITDNGTHYAWADITDDQIDFWIIRRQISQVYAADLMTMSTCFRTAANHYVYKDHVTKQQVYELYHNPTETANAFIKIGGESGSSVEVFTDVDDLPTTGISKDTIYRTRDVSYEYEGVQFPKSEIVLYGPGPDCTSMDADDVGVNIRAASGNRSYPWNAVNDTLIQELEGLNLVAVGVAEADAVFFSHSTTYGPKSGLTTVYGDYHLYHNPTETAAGYIEIGGGSVDVDGVTTEEVNGKVQANALIDVTVLPTTDIKAKSLYRLECKRYIYDSAEIPKPQGYKAVTGAAVTIDATGITYGGTTTAWADVTDTYINDLVTANVLAECEFDEAALYKLGADSYVLASLVTEETYWQLWYNPTGVAADYHRIGEECYTKKEVDAIVARIDEDILEIVERINEIEEVAARALVDLNKKKVEKSETTGLYAYTHDGDAQGEMEVKKAIGDNDPTSQGPHASDDNLASELAIRKAIDAAKSVKYVSTFTGVTGNKDILYYLDTAYGAYTVGFYRFIPAEGAEPAKFEPLGADAEAIIEVNSLPTTDIKTKSLYRRMETVYKHDGVEVPNVTIYKVNLNDTIEATPEGMRYKPSGPVVAWNDANIGAVIQQAITDGQVETTTWDDAEFFAYGDGAYDYENHFSRILPGSLWQNRTGAAAGWEEVGGEQPVDEVTIVEEHGILKAIAVIDVTTLPSAGMKANSLYRKVETVMVPGLHIYTTYYHGGNDPVPEPVECYKPARAGVEFRTNEIYIDGVEHSYEELRAYRELWVQMGYIVACDFLDIDTTTNDGAVGYPNEGSYQFLNRERYTYDTDPVPVVMTKIFQYTPGGAWESISTVELSNAAYNALDYTQKMDGTTYIVEG